MPISTILNMQKCDYHGESMLNPYPDHNQIVGFDFSEEHQIFAISIIPSDFNLQKNGHGGSKL